MLHSGTDLREKSWENREPSGEFMLDIVFRPSLITGCRRYLLKKGWDIEYAPGIRA